MTLSNETIELIEKKSIELGWKFKNENITSNFANVSAESMKAALTDPEILASVKGDGWVRKEDIGKVILWMCGYNDSEFPARKENDPPYYWRSILRAQFEKIGVDAEKYLPTPSSTKQVDGTHAMIKMACDTSSTVEEIQTYKWVNYPELPLPNIRVKIRYNNNQDEDFGFGSLVQELYENGWEDVQWQKEVIDAERKAYIKGRQTSQKGLEKLIEYIDQLLYEANGKETLRKEISTLKAVRIKATELLTKK